ncbi:MAG: FumA C-terminus/TtdB family hydratase beta subunit [Candidatus Geothermincolia bacterium]
MAEYELVTPLARAELERLRAGDVVRLSGIVYTARDQAHLRLVRALAGGETPPFELEGAVIYYAGPTPAPRGREAGSVGPTTAARMDRFTPALLERGLAATIGKGPRSEEVRGALARHGAVYLVAVGGLGALLGSHVRSMEVIAYQDLGPEAVRRLLVDELPLFVGYDTHGGDIFTTRGESFMGGER